MFNGASHVSVCRRYRDVSILSWRWVKMASCTSHTPTVILKIDLWSREKNQVKFHLPLQDVLYAKLNSNLSVIIVSIKPFEYLVLLWLLFLLKRVCFVLTVHLQCLSVSSYSTAMEETWPSIYTVSTLASFQPVICTSPLYVPLIVTN